MFISSRYFINAKKLRQADMLKIRDPADSRNRRVSWKPMGMRQYGNTMYLEQPFEQEIARKYMPHNMAYTPRKSASVEQATIHNFYCGETVKMFFCRATAGEDHCFDFSLW